MRVFGLLRGKVISPMTVSMNGDGHVFCAFSLNRSICNQSNMDIFQGLAGSYDTEPKGDIFLD